jgi:hypothetical protein
VTPQLLPILIPADQFPHVFAAGAVAALRNLIVHESLERVGQKNIHGARESKHLARIGKSAKSHQAIASIKCPTGLAAGFTLISMS